MDILLSGITGHMGREVLALAAAGVRGARVAGGIALAADDTLGVPVAAGFAQAAELFCGRAEGEGEAGANGAAPAAGRIPIDVIVDFSHHSWTADLMTFATAHNIPVVLATTGQTAAERDLILSAAERIPVFFAANFSMGVALLIELAKKAATVLPDAEIEIIERHHSRKLDAPSGTAIALANGINEARAGAMHAVCGRSGQHKREAAEIGISSVRLGNIVGEHEVLIGTRNEIITLKHEALSRGIFAEGALAAAAFLLGKDAGMYNMTHLTQD